MMNCRRFKIEIEELDFGIQPGSETHAHLRQCDRCRRFYDERLALRGMVNNLEVVSAPADFDFRLRARIALARNAGESGYGKRWFAQQRFTFDAPLSIALAACFALTIAAALRFTEIRNTNFNDAPAPVAKTPIVDLKVPATNETANHPANNPALETMAMRGLHDTQTKAVSKTTDSNDAIRRRLKERQWSRPASIVPVTQEGEDSNSLSLIGAKVIEARPTITIPLSVSAQPVRVVLGDERGAAQIVSIEPVSFGSPQFVQRLSDAAHGSASATEGVW